MQYQHQVCDLDYFGTSNNFSTFRLPNHKQGFFDFRTHCSFLAYCKLIQDLTAKPTKADSRALEKKKKK
jgi:hypothetical protein